MARIVSTGKTISLLEYHKKRIKEKRKAYLFIASIGFLIFILFLLALRIEKLRITSITVEGIDPIVAREATEIATTLLDGNYFFIFPKNSILFYPKEKITTEILTRMGRFESLNLSLGNASELVMKVSLREPHYMYCDDTKCFFVDREGLIYDNAPYFSSGIYLIFRNAEPQINPIGQRVLPIDEYINLSEFLNFLENITPALREVLISTKSITLTLETDATIRWGRGGSYLELKSDLNTFLENEKIKTDERFWEKVSDIDLRTENKVFYRFNKNSEI